MIEKIRKGNLKRKKSIRENEQKSRADSTKRKIWLYDEYCTMVKDMKLWKSRDEKIN